MSRAASARPSTARIATTPSRVQLVRVGAPAPRLRPADARARTAGGLLDERAEVDRRVAQGPSEPPDSPPSSSDAGTAPDGSPRWNTTVSVAIWLGFLLTALREDTLAPPRGVFEQ